MKSKKKEEERVKGVLYQSHSVADGETAESIINSVSRVGRSFLANPPPLPRPPFLTPPNFLRQRGRQVRGWNEPGRESQVAATINQISSKLSRLFDRHPLFASVPRHPSSCPSPSPLSETIGPRVNWKKRGGREGGWGEMSFRDRRTFSMIESSRAAAEQKKGAAKRDKA